MKKPKVTVLMPVYNAGKYLHEAIESILNQTFTDFEFLIINDKSTDNSVSVIESFKDSRIRLVHNEKNLGPIDTPNKGMKLAQGEYIARMDNDDISLPTRLSKEVSFLDAHTDYAVVATNIVLMNADGDETGYWENDLNTKTYEEIKSMLAKADCIAHPTVMMRKSVLDNYEYNNKQTGGDDWDLWMRLAADGIKIGKINEVLLKYRVLLNSVSRLNQTPKSSQERVIRIKRTFLLTQLGKLKINGFFISALYSYYRSIARWIKVYFLKDFMRMLKRILTTNPIIAYKGFVNLKKYLGAHSHRLILFFPYTHVGGAERIHFEIVDCLNDNNPLVFFTGFSTNDSFLKYFEPNAKVFNIPHTLNYPILSRKSRKLIADYINKQAKSITLGSNSIFYLGLLSQLSPMVFCVDIKHTYIEINDTDEIESLPKILRLNKRVFIGRNSMDNMIRLYHDNNIPRDISNRLVHIRNFTTIPDKFYPKVSVDNLKILYVGRISIEKRVDIILNIAVECHRRKLPVIFQLVCDKGKIRNSNEYPFIEFKGEITDKEKLDEIYKEAACILITSDKEGGLPLSGMEAMANGLVLVTTNVGDASLFISNYKNGFVTSSNDSEKVSSEMVALIKELCENRGLLETMSRNAYEQAKDNFSKADFCKSYRTLLGL